MWTYVAMVGLAVLVGVYNLPDGHFENEKKISSSQVEAYARNMIRYQRTIVRYVYDNPAAFGAINDEVVGFNEEYRKIGPWQARRQLNGDLIVWADDTLEIPQANLALQLSELTYGKYGVGIFKDDEIVSLENATKTVPYNHGDIPEGSAVYFSSINP